MTVKNIEQLPVATSVSSGDLVLLRQGGISKSIDATLLGGGGGGAVTSVAGRTGNVVLTSADVGLANVDNTSDVNKPVSTAQAAADAAVLAASAPIAHVGAGGAAHADVVASGASGFMTGADKAKLDGVASGATANTGTVTSVALSTPTGLTTSGSPVTSSGTLTISYTAGYSIPTTASQSNWDTAFADRNKWDGGATGLVAATGRTSLGATTVGGNLFTLTNPSAVTFPRFNADNTISALDAATFRTAIGAGAGVGTVTSASVVSANGFAGSVATATSTPAITISTTVTGLVKGNGTALAAATVRTDYAEPTTALATGILKNTTGTGAHTIAVAGDFPTLNQSTTGSAASLTTPRTIGGASFNGTANVTSFPAPGPIGGTTPNTGAFTTLSATGNVTLGDASTDTLNVGNGGLIKDASGNVGIGVTPSAWSGNFKALEVGRIGNGISTYTAASGAADLYLTSNVYYDSVFKYANSAQTAGAYSLVGSGHFWSVAPIGTAGDPITFTRAMTLDASGNLTVTGTVTAPTFSGALSGNASTATTAGNITGIAAIANGGTGASSESAARANLSVPVTTLMAPIPLENTESCVAYVSNALMGQPDGALYSHVFSAVWKHQIQGDYRTGQISVRGKNNGTWQAWRLVLDTGNFVAGTNYIAPTGSIAAATGLTSGQVVTALGYTPSAAASRTVSVISTNTTAVSGTTYVLTAALTLTLPASPSPGAFVPFSNRSGGSSCIIGRNGQPIMGLAEDMTIDVTNVGVELVYADATRGWVLI